MTTSLTLRFFDGLWEINRTVVQFHCLLKHSTRRFENGLNRIIAKELCRSSNILFRDNANLPEEMSPLRQRMERLVFDNANRSLLRQGS